MNSTCPIDAKKLSLTHADGLEVMSCAACNGAWLPATTAGALLARLAAASPQQQAFFDKVRLEGRDSKLACLECGAAMRTVAHRKVDIDVCQDCGGIWFDGGELQRFRQADFKKPAKVAGVVVGATALAAAGVAGAAALEASQPASPVANAASGIGDVVVNGVLEVAGDVAGDVFSAILESIFS